MVVIEGPRFSTRAESQWYAAQGWDLVNMTGHPEAVLARELGVCYATLALVTDLDAGVERRGGGRPGPGVRPVRAEPRAAQDAAGRRDRPVAADPPGGGCSCAGWHEGVSAPLRAAMRVLLTGAAGFIGGRRRARPCAQPATRSIGVDALIPQAHGATPRRPSDVIRGSTSATPTCGPTCCAGSTSCATRPRWSAPGSGRRPPAVSPPTTTSAPRCSSPRCARRGSPAWSWPPRWSSTARAATPAPSTAPQAPGPADRSRISTPAASTTRCPACGGAAGLGAGRRGRPARPAHVVRRQQGRPGALRRGLGPPGARPGRRAALPQRLRAPDAAGHPLLRGRGDLPLRARAGRAAGRLRGRRADARLRPRRRRGPGEPRWPARRSAQREAVARPFAAYNVCSGTPGLGCWTSRRRWSAAGRRPSSPWSAVATGPATCGTSWPRRELAAAELGFTRPDRPAEGLRAFAHDPLRWATAASPGREEQVLARSRAKTTCAAKPHTRHRRGSRAVVSSSHGTKGSQIRSTSALLIRLRSATRTVSEPRRRRARPATRRRASSRVVARAGRSAADAGGEQRAGAEQQGGQVAEDPVGRRAGPRRCRPSSGRGAPGGRPSRRSRGVARPGSAPAPATAARAAARQDRPSPEHGERQDAEQQQTVGEQHAARRAAARPARPSPPRRSGRTGPPERERQQPQADDGGEHRVGGDRQPDRRRARRPGRAPPGGRPPRRPACATVCSTAGGDGRGEHDDHQPTARSRPSPSRTSADEEQQRHGRMAGDVRGPLAQRGVDGDPLDEGVQHRRDVGDRRAVCRYSCGSSRIRPKPGGPVQPASETIQARPSSDAVGAAAGPTASVSARGRYQAHGDDGERERGHRAAADPGVPGRDERGVAVGAHLPAGDGAGSATWRPPGPTPAPRPHAGPGGPRSRDHMADSVGAPERRSALSSGCPSPFRKPERPRWDPVAAPSVTAWSATALSCSRARTRPAPCRRCWPRSPTGCGSLVVDNGSTDGTATVARELGAAGRDRDHGPGTAPRCTPGSRPPRRRTSR